MDRDEDWDSKLRDDLCQGPREPTDAEAKWLAGRADTGGPDGCWVWQRATNGKYPKTGQNVYAHREAFRLFRGRIPQGHHIAHRCDRPLCVRPDHLFAATRKRNMEDAVRKGRMPRGEDAPHASLTWGDVRVIRRRNPLTEEAIRATAREFGVSRRTLFRVLLQETWITEGRRRFAAFVKPENRHVVRVTRNGQVDDLVQAGYMRVPPALERSARTLVARKTDAHVSEMSGGKMSRWLDAITEDADLGQVA